VKTFKLFLALGLAAALFVGCSKSDTNANSSNSSTTKASNSSTTTTTTATTNTPGTTTSPSNTTTSSNSSSSSSSPGGGQTFTHQEGGLQFTVPAGWKAEPQGEKMLVSSADGALAMFFWVPQGEDFDKAVSDLGTQLEKVIGNAKTTTPGHETTHNGMRAYTGGGTGEVNNQPMAWEVDILQAKKPVFIVTFASPDQFASHADEYNHVLSSIKRVE